METVSVTGIGGFIGSHLATELIKKGFTFSDVAPNRVYHLACPSTTFEITNNTTKVMDTIFDLTRQVIKKYPNSKIINASSMGAGFIDDSAQGAYNVAKRSMEIYLAHSGVDYVNYRIPAVYGPGMKDDHFIKRCVNGKAFRPVNPERVYYIAHVSEVVDALVELRDIEIEEITLGEIYEQFTSGRRGLYRPAPRS